MGGIKRNRGSQI